MSLFVSVSFFYPDTQEEMDSQYFSLQICSFYGFGADLLLQLTSENTQRKKRDRIE